MRLFIKHFLICSFFGCFFFVLLIFSIDCGLPNSNTYDDLNAPTGLSIPRPNGYIQGSYIKIQFICYNYEENFSGYNIYIANEKDTLSLSSIAYNHTTLQTETGEFTENIETRNKYIIKNKEGGIPTITKETLLEYYNIHGGTLTNLWDKTIGCYKDCSGNVTEFIQIGEFNQNCGTTVPELDKLCRYKLNPFIYSDDEFKIDKLPNGQSLELKEHYKIVVTAYDEEYLVESNASNEVLTSKYTND